MGSITKIGSRMVRYLLAQAIQHVLRRDGNMRAWFQRIKRRRGSKIARVAVMRRTATIMWRMLSTGQPWRPGKSNSETQSATGAPGQANSRRCKSSPTLVSDCEPDCSSTGSTSLLAGEEVAPCPV